MLLFLSVVLNACKTYLIPVQSFKEQFNGIDSTKLRLVKESDPMVNALPGICDASIRHGRP